MLISLFMTDHSQAMQLSYYIIIVSSEMHVQLEIHYNLYNKKTYIHKDEIYILN